MNASKGPKRGTPKGVIQTLKGLEAAETEEDASKCIERQEYEVRSLKAPIRKYDKKF